MLGIWSCPNFIVCVYLSKFVLNLYVYNGLIFLQWVNGNDEVLFLVLFSLADN